MYCHAVTYGVALAAVALMQGGSGKGKPVAERPFHIESRGAAPSFEELWSRSNVVLEGLIESERPADYMVRGTSLVHTMYDVRVLAVYKTSERLSRETIIQVRRRGGTRDVGDRIEAHVADNFPLFTQGERYIMFLRETEWVQPSPYQGVYYYGTTYDGPDSFFQVHGSVISTHAKTLLARSLAAINSDALRAQLRRAGGSLGFSVAVSDSCSARGACFVPAPLR
jgi:hypothetical protein